MPSFYDDFPNPDIIFELEPEELATKILFYLKSSAISQRTTGRKFFHSQDFSIPLEREDLLRRKEEIEGCILESWS